MYTSGLVWFGWCVEFVVDINLAMDHLMKTGNSSPLAYYSVMLTYNFFIVSKLQIYVQSNSLETVLTKSNSYKGKITIKPYLSGHQSKTKKKRWHGHNPQCDRRTVGQGETKTAQKSKIIFQNSGFFATQSKDYTLDNMFLKFFGLKRTISAIKFISNMRFITNLW